MTAGSPDRVPTPSTHLLPWPCDQLDSFSRSWWGKKRHAAQHRNELKVSLRDNNILCILIQAYEPQLHVRVCYLCCTRVWHADLGGIWYSWIMILTHRGPNIHWQSHRWHWGNVKLFQFLLYIYIYIYIYLYSISISSLAIYIYIYIYIYINRWETVMNHTAKIQTGTI